MLSAKVVTPLVFCALVGCRISGAEGATGVFMPGASASIRWVTTTVAGGRQTITSEILDSATATVSLQSCEGSFDQVCSQSFVRPARDGAVIALFTLVSSRDFRAVRNSYPRPAGVVAPDPGSARLTVTFNERQRVITWEKESVLPDVLLRLRCWLSAAEGQLILCGSQVTAFRTLLPSTS